MPSDLYFDIHVSSSFVLTREWSKSWSLLKSLFPQDCSRCCTVCHDQELRSPEEGVFPDYDLKHDQKIHQLQAISVSW